MHFKYIINLHTAAIYDKYRRYIPLRKGHTTSSHIYVRTSEQFSTLISYSPGLILLHNQRAGFLRIYPHPPFPPFLATAALAINRFIIQIIYCRRRFRRLLRHPGNRWPESAYTVYNILCTYCRIRHTRVNNAFLSSERIKMFTRIL